MGRGGASPKQMAGGTRKPLSPAHSQLRWGENFPKPASRIEPLNRRSWPGSADWQSAVSRIGNPQARRARSRPADCQSATQQVANLRYAAGVRGKLQPPALDAHWDHEPCAWSAKLQLRAVLMRAEQELCAPVLGKGVKLVVLSRWDHRFAPRKMSGAGHLRTWYPASGLNDAMNRTDHWEQVYQTKAPDDVSWFQARLTTSLNPNAETGMRALWHTLIAHASQPAVSRISQP